MQDGLREPSKPLDGSQCRIARIARKSVLLYVTGVCSNLDPLLPCFRPKTRQIPVRFRHFCHFRGLIPGCGKRCPGSGCAKWLSWRHLGVKAGKSGPKWSF